MMDGRWEIKRRKNSTAKANESAVCMAMNHLHMQQEANRSCLTKIWKPIGSKTPQKYTHNTGGRFFTGRVLVVAFLVLAANIMLDQQAVVDGFSTNHPPFIPRQLKAERKKNEPPSCLSLVPSQIVARHPSKLNNSSSSRKKSTKSQSSSKGSFSYDLIPSQVRVSRRETSINSASSRIQTQEGSTEDAVPAEEFIRTDADDPVTSSKKTRRNPKSKKSKNRKRAYLGNFPDIHWRALPLEHLRLHPRYDALPESVSCLKSLEDARLFRQESWQWDALHKGRCTTSQAAGALGLMEPKASAALNIPMSWRGGEKGTRAFHRLSQDALCTLDEMNELLCTDTEHDGPLEETKKRVWTIPSGKNANGKRFPFAAKYLPKTTAQEHSRRKQRAEDHAHQGIMPIRLLWGDAQEAVSVLTALNYFWKREPGIRVQEVGMCGAGLTVNQTHTESSMLIGATPDAILRYPNGTVEALEVKNHCPYITARWTKPNETPRFAIRRMPFREPYVSPHYVPQLMMEMLCVGPECHSAVMVRQTATNGAIILRIHRDDGWLDEMLFWLNKFQRDYVNTGTPPPANFFWDDEEYGERYKRFVDWTKELGSKVDLLDHVQHNNIQRVMAADSSQSSMFLD